MIGAFLLLAAAPFQTPVEFSFKKDQNWSLFVTQEFSPPSVEAGEESHVFGYRLDFKVKSADAKGVSLQSERILLAERFDGIELPPPKNAKPFVEKFAIRPEAIFDFEVERYGDPVEFRLSRLAWLFAPKDFRMTWTLRWPTIEPNWAPAAEMAFSQPDKQPSDTEVTYHVRYKEFGLQPKIEGEGRAVFERSTMNLLHFEGTYRGVLIPGGAGLHGLRMKVRREVKLDR